MQIFFVLIFVEENFSWIRSVCRKFFLEIFFQIFPIIPHFLFEIFQFYRLGTVAVGERFFSGVCEFWCENESFISWSRSIRDELLTGATHAQITNFDVIFYTSAAGNYGSIRTVPVHFSPSKIATVRAAVPFCLRARNCAQAYTWLALNCTDFFPSFQFSAYAFCSPTFGWSWSLRSGWLQTKSTTQFSYFFVGKYIFLLKKMSKFFKLGCLRGTLTQGGLYWNFGKEISAGKR